MYLIKKITCDSIFKERVLKGSMCVKTIQKLAKAPVCPPSFYIFNLLYEYLDLVKRPNSFFSMKIIQTKITIQLINSENEKSKKSLNNYSNYNLNKKKIYHHNTPKRYDRFEHIQC